MPHCSYLSAVSLSAGRGLLGAGTPSFSRSQASAGGGRPAGACPVSGEWVGPAHSARLLQLAWLVSRVPRIRVSGVPCGGWHESREQPPPHSTLRHECALAVRRHCPVFVTPAASDLETRPVGFARAGAGREAAGRKPCAPAGHRGCELRPQSRAGQGSEGPSTWAGHRRIVPIQSLPNPPSTPAQASDFPESAKGGEAAWVGGGACRPESEGGKWRLLWFLPRWWSELAESPGHVTVSTLSPPFRCPARSATLSSAEAPGPLVWESGQSCCPVSPARRGAP